MTAGFVQGFALVVVVVCILPGTLGCFIRNCPPGGKRGLDMKSDSQRECMPCGPGGRGQCVGPNICCGADIGCFIGTQESSICQKENESTSPCRVRGASCGARGQGNCVADSLCCDSEACSYNRRCESRPEVNSKEDLMQLVQQLLRSKNYD